MPKKKKSPKKCFMCKKPVKNENITKNGHFFCCNDCDAKYYMKLEKKTNQKRNRKILEEIQKKC